MYKLSYVVRVTAPDVEELKRRCNQVRDFYDDASIKLVRPIGDMMGLHSEFIPASKRYMNDYVQYVTSDFLAGLGFGATQMLGERDGIYSATMSTPTRMCMCSLQERHKALRVLLPMRCPVRSSALWAAVNRCRSTCLLTTLF